MDFEALRALILRSSFTSLSFILLFAKQPVTSFCRTEARICNYLLPTLQIIVVFTQIC